MKKEQKAETLFCGITNISDAVINEAASGALPAKRAPWVKWGAVAACACLLATGAFVLARARRHGFPRGAPMVGRLPAGAVFPIQLRWNGAGRFFFNRLFRNSLCADAQLF